MKEKVAETTGGDTGCETTSAMKAATITAELIGKLIGTKHTSLQSISKT